ncbi:hypothetical protein Trydic_g19461 [Trypoxylus dichotomus]
MEEQYLLRWHRHETTLTKNLPALLESNVLTDCTVAAGCKTYRAHKQNVGPLESSIIVLHDVNAEDIEVILSYIYRGQCFVTKTQIPRLVHLAKTLKIQGLCNMKIQDSNENTVISPAESNYTNEECELENTQIGAVSLDDSPKSLPQEGQELKQEHSSTIVNQSETVSKKTLKDSPEICKCFICGKYLSNQYNLRVHMETHKDTYYSCLSCPHVSKSRDALRKHVSYRHPEEYISRKRKKNTST